MGLEERRREKPEECSVKTDHHRCRYRGILEQETDHGVRHRDAQNDAAVQEYKPGLETRSDREQEISSADVEMAIFAVCLIEMLRLSHVN